jgi:eukaryotic-like serine/threonine-protein kinase
VVSLKSFFFTRLIPALALVKAVAGLAAWLVSFRTAPADPLQFPYVLYLFFMLEFGATAALLILGGREDRRAQLLGFFFLTAVTAWADHPLQDAAVLLGGSVATLAALLKTIEPGALMAFYMWSFARDFPAPPQAQEVGRQVDAMVMVSAAAGAALFGLNLLLPALSRTGLGPFFALFAPMRGTGLYFGIVMPLTAAAIAYLVIRGSFRGEAENRRLRVFLLGMACGLGPLFLEVLAELLPFGYRPWTLVHPRYKLASILTVGLLTILTPAGTAYATLVHRVLDVRLIARRALQYALARFSALTLATVPLLAIVVYLYHHREESITQVFSGNRLLLLITAASVGAATLRYRGALLDAVDRRFFREQYDARQILTLLVERIRATSDAASLASLVAREIDLALHLEGISLLALDERSGMLNDPRRRTNRLDASSALALLISNASDPLATDLEDPRSPLAPLPEKDRHWLVDSGFKLIVPILARDGSLLGLIGLGQKKSGLPFLKEDRQLLHAIASSAAWVLELAQTHSTGHSTGPRRLRDADLDDTEAALPAADLAKECTHCGMLYPSYTVLCVQCSRRLELAHVPYVLPGKFRFEKRIGSGGMGVVYRGADLALGRPVAVKTLRRVSPEDAMRLRREARTAAAVTHRHLAPVYGMETWQGTPMLVLELLEGGTLAHRIEKGRMQPLEMVELGIAMADALAQLHASDILHRDIKPSNIGFTRDGVPKLMDFGIARATFDLRHDRALGALESDDDSFLPATAVWSQSPTSLTLTQQLVGTLSYLSPEAISGETPTASFDLWSLSIVLYECLLGRKIFSGGDPKQLMSRIRLGRVPEFAQVLPQADESLGEFFRSALHKTLSRRPASAVEMRQRLETVRARLQGRTA